METPRRTTPRRSVRASRKTASKSSVRAARKSASKSIALKPKSKKSAEAQSRQQKSATKISAEERTDGKSAEAIRPKVKFEELKTAKYKSVSEMDDNEEEEQKGGKELWPMDSAEKRERLQKYEDQTYNEGKFAINSVVYDVRDQEQGGTDWHMLVPLRAMYTQAFVAVEGLHSVMGKYGVQAITVAVPSLNSYPLRKSTRLMEAIARALNNVLERFHQSYFLSRVNHDRRIEYYLAYHEYRYGKYNGHKCDGYFDHGSCRVLYRCCSALAYFGCD
ncbi:hypothetical protein TELCIR_12211, partial [Teladorsagia circumcincta]